jgi:hypothetical protein
MRRLALLLVPLTLAGCLEREERVRVLPTGALEITHTLKGDPGDFDATRGDALPSGTPWLVRDEDVTKEDGRVVRVRRASATFGSAKEVPTTFGDAAALRFTTSLSVERLDGGRVRYTLERRYAPRAWAWRARLEKLAIPDDLRAALGEKRDGPLPDDLLRRVIDAALTLKRDEARAHLDAALTAIAPAVDPAARLRARAAFDAAYAEAWQVDALLPAVKEPAAMPALEARFRDETARAAGRAAALALGADVEAAARAAFEAERRVLEVSEDLRDESFVVRVELPVGVTSHDGEALEDGGRTAVFRFKGEDLCDREHVLRVVAEGTF